jgi:hypothetical protein
VGVDPVAHSPGLKTHRGGIGGSFEETVLMDKQIDGQGAYDTDHACGDRSPDSVLLGQLGSVDLSGADLFDQAVRTGLDHFFYEFEAVGFGYQICFLINQVNHGY